MPNPDNLIPPPLIKLLREVRSVAVLTGAGISAESGIPTFRDAQTGLWAQYRAEDLATPEAFRRNPKLVWEWYAMRRAKVLQARPNPGHLALARLEAHYPKYTLITQNVDGLHRQAGSLNLVELHGNILRSKCVEEGTLCEPDPTDQNIPPRCPHCGAYLRPDVVWFGENLPKAALTQAFNAAASSEVFFSVGTSTLVQPAASLPFAALDNGRTVVEINPTETPLTSLAQFVLSGPAGEVLPRLLTAVWPEE